MARTASAKPKPFRRARASVASALALGLGGLAASVAGFTDAGRTLELVVSDRLRSARPLSDAPGANPFLTVEIDDRALAHPEGGRWAPWPRPKQAAFLEAIASLGPRLIVLDIEYADPETRCVALRPRADGRLEAYIQEQPDARLREAVARAGNVVLPFSLYFHRRAGTTGGAAPRAGPGGDGGDEPANPAFLARHALAGAEIGEPLLVAEGVNPMIEPLAEVALGAGYTSLPKKDPDQAVRRVPLLARLGGRVFPHLGLEMAGLWRFGPDYRVRLEGGRLVLTSADGALAVGVAVEPRATLNLRWPRDLAAAKRDAISAAPVLDLVRDRRRLDHLDARWRLVMAELAALLPEVGWTEARAALDRALREAGLTAVDLAQNGGEAAAPPAVRAAAEALSRVEERLVLEAMSRTSPAASAETTAPSPGNSAARPEGPSPPAGETVGPAADADLPVPARLARLLEVHGPFIASYHDLRARRVAEVRESAERLRPYVAGRAVLVGLAMTAGTDLHKTPIADVEPGVEVYPAVARTILSGVAFRRLGRWSEWTVAVLAAWLVGVLAVRLPTGWAAAAAVGIGALVCGGAYLGASAAALLLPVAGPLLAGVVAFAAVSAYRQLTEARSRRWITRVFEQYTSPEIVEEITGNPEALRLGGERRDITVIFSDIAGFTPLSERMEPEKLSALLQHYLGRMTAILHQHRATLDKYEGDGIMAFVGAPTETADHALRAVRAALAMQEAVPKVRDELVAAGLLAPDRPFHIRIGCSSGPASVGNFGSETRFDYTAMGDTVNLGARLEEANRWLGTKILVPESTRRACGEAVLFRPVGLARIRGKAEPLRLYEPLALEPAPEPLRRLAEAFGRAVEALEAGDLAAAEAALADCLAARPDDPPTQALARRIEAVRSGWRRPEEPWNLARPKEEASQPAPATPSSRADPPQATDPSDGPEHRPPRGNTP